MTACACRGVANHSALSKDVPIEAGTLDVQAKVRVTLELR